MESLERRRDLAVSALYGNPVYEENKEAKRTESVKQIEEGYAEVINIVLKGKDAQDEEIDYDQNEFFAAGKRGMDKMNVPRADEGAVDQTTSTREVLEDEREARRLMDELDQM